MEDSADIFGISGGRGEGWTPQTPPLGTPLVQIHPPFYIPTLPSWITVKSHWSLTDSIVKILNTLFLLAHSRNAVPSSQLAQSPRVLLALSLSLSIALSCYTNPLQSPSHPKLKVLILNNSIQSNKCITLTLHKTITIAVISIWFKRLILENKILKYFWGARPEFFIWGALSLRRCKIYVLF